MSSITFSRDNYNTALTFIRVLSGGDGTQEEVFQTFDDDSDRKASHLAKTNRTTLVDGFAKLKEMNKKGAGVFVTIQQMDGSGRRCSENCVAVRTIALDFDNGFPQQWHLEPSMIVESSKGKGHAYWVLQESVPMTSAHYKSLLERLFDLYSATPPDKACSDLARVLRPPGFYNVKPKYGQPQLVRFLSCNDTRYTVDQVMEGVPEKSHKQHKSRSSNSPVNAVSWSELVKKYKETAELADESLADSAEATIKSQMATAVKNKQGVHHAIVCSGVAATHYALIHGVNKAYKLMKIHADSAYKALGRESDERVGDDKRAFAWGLTLGLDVAKQELAEMEQMRQLSAETVNVKWVSEAGAGNIASKIVGIKSPPGTGKTTWVVDFVANLEPHNSVLILSHRVLLLLQWLGALGSQFHYYQDGTGKMANSARIICSYDSLHKLRGRIFDYVVFDEADEGIPHLLSAKTAITRTRRQALETMKMLCYNAEQVFLLSAYLSDLEVEFIKRLSESDDVKTKHNLVLPPKRLYKKFTRASAIEAQVVNSLLADRKVFILCDSSTYARQLEEKLKQTIQGIKTKLVNKQTEDKHEMRSANEYFKGYDAVLCSPTAFTGVDISAKGMIDEVFGIFTNTGDSIGVFHLIQAVNRVRHPVTNTINVYVAQRMNLDTPENEKEAAIMAGASEDNLAQFLEYAKDGSLMSSEQLSQLVNTYEEFFGKYDIRQKKEAESRGRKFWHEIAKQGHDVETASCPVNKGMVDLVKKVKETLEEQDLLTILNAERISSYDASLLIATPNRTAREEAQLERYNIRRDLGNIKLSLALVQHYFSSAKYSSLLMRRFYMPEEVAATKDEYQMSQLKYDRKDYAAKRQFAITLVNTVNEILERSNYCVTQDDLGNEWLELMKSQSAMFADYRIPVKPSQPMATFLGTLERLEYSAEKKRVRIAEDTLQELKAEAEKANVTHEKVKAAGKDLGIADGRTALKTKKAWKLALERSRSLFQLEGQHYIKGEATDGTTANTHPRLHSDSDLQHQYTVSRSHAQALLFAKIEAAAKSQVNEKSIDAYLLNHPLTIVIEHAQVSLELSPAVLARELTRRGYTQHTSGVWIEPLTSDSIDSDSALV